MREVKESKHGFGGGDGTAKRRSHRRGAVQLALLGLIAIGLVLLPARAGAVQLNGVFELDGNAVVNHNSPGLPDD